jgi:hypothetical protein
MSRRPRFTLSILLLFASACSSHDLPVSKPTDSTDPQVSQRKSGIDEKNPLKLIFLHADKVRNRLRYFAEDLKTTYKPEKQAALLLNVHETVHPACEEMKRIIENSNSMENRVIAEDMGAACARIDAALEKRDLDLLRPAIHEFNSAFERLAAVLK